MLWDAMMDGLVAGSREVPASVDATFSWYFRDEDRWLTVESRGGRVSVRPGLASGAEMRFYSSCVADFIHQHATEGAGRAIFQGGGFYYRGDLTHLPEIAAMSRVLFGPKLFQRLNGAGIQVPKFEARRYPARTKAQRDRILAEWMTHGGLHEATSGAVVSTLPPPRVIAEPPAVEHETPRVAHTEPVRVTRTVPAKQPVAKAAAMPVKAARVAPKAAPAVTKAAKPVKAAKPSAKTRPAASGGKKVRSKAAKVAR